MKSFRSPRSFGPSTLVQFVNGSNRPSKIRNLDAQRPYRLVSIHVSYINARMKKAHAILSWMRKNMKTIYLPTDVNYELRRFIFIYLFVRTHLLGGLKIFSWSGLQRALSHGGKKSNVLFFISDLFVYRGVNLIPRSIKPALKDLNSDNLILAFAKSHGASDCFFFFSFHLFLPSQFKATIFRHASLL